MTLLPKRLTPFRLWMIVFGLWSVFLTGALARFVGSPGVIQAMHLRALLSTKQTQLAKLQDEINKLQADASELEHNKVAQHREVRRVLGYAANDELIFDFTSPDSL